MHIESKNTIRNRPGSAIWGNLNEFRSDLLRFLHACRQDQGKVAGFRLGHRRIVLISDPELIEQVLVLKNKSFKKHFAVRLLKPLLGNGLLLNEGDSWLAQRRLVQPAFSQKFVDDLVKIARRHTTNMATEWRKSPQRDIYEDMTRLTVRIAAEAFLGISDSGDEKEVGDHLDVIHSDFEHRFQHVIRAPLWIPTKRNRKLKRAIDGLTMIIDRMIESRSNESQDKHDALSLLLRARDEKGRGMSRQQLRDEVMTLLLAGHDTTANGLTWSWVLLAEHSKYLSEIQKEVSATQEDRPFRSATLTSNVFKEAMRLFPPVYLFGREAKESVAIGNCKIKRGVSVVMSPWVVHRDNELFQDAASFQPHRWSPDFEKSLHRYAYFPFGGGPRVCLGKYVAMVEAEVVLSTLASRFNIELSHPHSTIPWPAVTLRPRDPVRAEVTALTSSRAEESRD